MSTTTLKSDVAGRIWQVLKSVGDPVAKDESVMVIEAMKMEIPVYADSAGTIQAILVSEGDEVVENQPVARLVAQS